MIEVIIISAYFLLTIAIGTFSQRAKNASSFEGYKMGLLMCVAVGAGEWMGGTSTTGVSEYGYLYGISGAWYTIANGIGICFLAIFFAKLFRSLNSSTVPEIIGKYLGKKSRIVSSVLLLIVLVIVGVSQMIAIGTLGESILHLDHTISIFILGLGVLIYTCAGGMNAIGYTNIMHMIVMYAGMLLALFISAKSSGSLREQLPDSFFSPVSIGYDKVISWIIASVLGACTAQAGLQPILKSKDEKTAVQSSFLIAAIVAPFGIFTAMLGMYSRIHFPALSNAKLALPSLLMSMNPWLSGLVLAAILAAVLSTASPIFLSCGTLITRDLYCELWPHGKDATDTELLKVSRTATFAVGIVTICLALLLSGATTILDIVYFAYSLRGSLFVVLLFGIFWKKMNQQGAISAMGTTAVVGFFWVAYKKTTGQYPIPFLNETYASVLTTIIVGVVVSLITNRKSANAQLREDNRMRKSVVEYVAQYASGRKEQVAVMTAQQRITYAELYDYVQGYAKYLRCSGVEKGDIVLVKASQTEDYPVIYLGIHLAGGVVMSLEKNITDEGMQGIARTMKVHAVISDTMPQIAGVKIIPRDGVFQKADAHLRDETELDFPNIEDTADILFTTGTTGASKGVELSHRALTATAENLIFGCEYKKDTVMIVPGPLNHANAVRKMFTSFVNGSTIYILNGMSNIRAFFNALDCQDGTIACCLPPAAIRVIFQLTDDKIGDYADRIDFIESATSPLPETDKQRLCKLLPMTRLYNNYGSSEAASVCMYNYNQYRDKENCVGRAMPNSRVIIVDDDHNVIQSSKDNVGLVATIGDVNMKGYVNEPNLTKEVLNNGVVYTSDLGYIDQEGFVYIIGRKGDVINVGGLKVAPSEVESVALGNDDIDDCICIAVPDPVTSNALKLLVVMHKGKELDEAKMKIYMSRHLEAYKIPRYYERVDMVERTYNGKLNRKYYRQLKAN